MFWLLTFLLAIPSPLIPIISSEGWAVFVGIAGTRPWPLLALTLAAGQCVAFSLLFFFGDRFLRRLPWIQRKLERFDVRRYQRQSAWWILAGGVVGVPPLVLLAAAAAVIRIRYRAFLLFAFVGRLLRFGVLAAVPRRFAEWFPMEWVPDWIARFM